MSKLKNYAVILAGGQGERFWPMSRPELPKQFLTIFNRQPLIEQTRARLSGHFAKNARIFVIPEQLKTVAKRYLGGENMLIEPSRRNTGPAICLAALALKKKYGDGILHVMPSDHIIRPIQRFIADLHRGEKYAARGCLVTYGIMPTRPDTGYGYVKIGRRFEKNVFCGQGFKEKPTLGRARAYLSDGTYLWNSGIFSFRIASLLDEIKNSIPEVYRGVTKYFDTGNRAYFSHVPDISIDYGIMEKSRRIVIVRANFAWDDLGSWTALERYFSKDQSGNIVAGDVAGLEIENSIVYTSDMPVRIYGVKNLIVVASPHGVLVCDKNRVADLKEVLRIKRRLR